MNGLERVTLGTYGNRTTGTIHIDARELLIARTQKTDTLPNRRLVARLAIADLRNGGVPGLIIAHINGVRGGGA